MAASHLTARGCAAARPKLGADGKPQQTSFYDDDPKGLELRVSAEGRKVWSFRYRTLDGRQRRLTLGQFAPGEEDQDIAAEPGQPQPLTLRAARRRARQARAMVESGGDPAAEKRKSRDAARNRKVRSFQDLSEAYLTACEHGEWKPKGKAKRPRTIADERAILKRYVLPTLGALSLEEVDRTDVKKVLRAMVARKIGAQTNRTHAVIRQIYSWAVAEELVETNPATGFSPLATESPRARIVSDKELKLLWKALNAPGKFTMPTDPPTPLYLSRPVAIVLQLAALLLQRRGEIAGMQVAEVNLAERTWLIPSERTKNGRPHLVPLPPAALALVEEAIGLAAFGRDKAPSSVFPGWRDGSKAIRPDSVSHSLADVAAACGVTGITVHDLRRTGASALVSERLSITPFIVSRVLGHGGDTGGAAQVTLTHYALYDYAPEKRRALEAWEGLLMEIVTGVSRAPNVRPLRGAVA